MLSESMDGLWGPAGVVLKRCPLRGMEVAFAGRYLAFESLPVSAESRHRDRLTDQTLRHWYASQEVGTHRRHRRLTVQSRVVVGVGPLVDLLTAAKVLLMGPFAAFEAAVAEVAVGLETVAAE